MIGRGWKLHEKRPKLRGSSREVSKQALVVSLCAERSAIMLCFDENQHSRASLSPVGQFTTIQDWDPTGILAMPMVAIDTVPYSTP